jgi:hypothetical protein
MATKVMKPPDELKSWTFPKSTGEPSDARVTFPRIDPRRRRAKSTGVVDPTATGTGVPAVASHEGSHRTSS